MPWQVWLKIHINIPASHSRNLRQLGTLVRDYPKLKSNDSPRYEILRNQKLLKEMLAIPEYAAFWREGINIPLKTHLSLEQSTMRPIQKKKQVIFTTPKIYLKGHTKHGKLIRDSSLWDHADESDKRPSKAHGPQAKERRHQGHTPDQ